MAEDTNTRLARDAKPSGLIQHVRHNPVEQFLMGGEKELEEQQRNESAKMSEKRKQERRRRKRYVEKAGKRAYE